MNEEFYMKRCLQLAKNGQQNARPNPMVGAVIVSADNRIIGEGYHVRCGEGHAEVNAFASVKPEDEHLLSEATIYVSLEPCAHYGKTPPCAELIIRKGVKRCVVGCVDPFAKVKGKGIQMILDAGIEVKVGVLENECMELNRHFMTRHSKQRPYTLLKWAQTEDGFLDNDGKALALSSPYTKMLMHKLRSEYDAIAVGRITDEREHPQLNVREWYGHNPQKLVLTSREEADYSPYLSLMVEGGEKALASFLESGEWDEIRVETAPILIHKGTKAPRTPYDARLVSIKEYDGRRIATYRRQEEYAK